MLTFQKTITDYLKAAYGADVIVKREGPYAVAVDREGRIIAKSTYHGRVLNEAVSYVAEKFYGGVIKLIGEFYLDETVNVEGYSSKVCW